MNAPTPPQYVTSLEEIFWAGLLIAITMAVHGFGMISVARTNAALKERFPRTPSFVSGVSILVLSSWMILLVHLVEVFAWAGFFYWQGAVNTSADGPGTAPANPSLCYYFALLDYTCLGSNYNLHQRWRLLEGMISMAGLLTFAWSTGVLFTLAQSFQDEQLQLLKNKREKQRMKSAARSGPLPLPRSENPHHRQNSNHDSWPGGQES
jgi:hypothetical protein